MVASVPNQRLSSLGMSIKNTKVAVVKQNSRMLCRKQQGIGIIEVLIALVVVSLGVLGMASLQLTGIKHSSSGFNRSMAVLFTENLASRIRSNPDSVQATHYAGYDSAGVNCNTRPAPFCQASIGVAAETCEPAEMAAFDLYSIACGSIGSDGEARDGVTNLLNAGRLQVQCADVPCESNSNYTLTITWNEGSTTTGQETEDIKTVQVRFNP